MVLFFQGTENLPLFALFEFKFLLRVLSIHLSSTIFFSYDLLLRALQNTMILSVIISIYFHTVDKNTTVFQVKNCLS